MDRQAETPAATPAREHISFETFLRQYEGVHAEWLMGEINIMSNNTAHQLLLLFLSHLVSWYVGLKGLGEVLLAGVPMYVGQDSPAREPDLMIVFNQHLDRIRATYLDGAADVVFEIVSPESSERDYGAKFHEYEAAGVAEYWRIDPLRRAVDVYALSPDGRYQRVSQQDGKAVSRILPGFAVPIEVFWEERFPKGSQLLTLVQAMVTQA